MQLKDYEVCTPLSNRQGKETIDDSKHLLAPALVGARRHNIDWHIVYESQSAGRGLRALESPTDDVVVCLPREDHLSTYLPL